MFDAQKEAEKMHNIRKEKESREVQWREDVLATLKSIDNKLDKLTEDK